MLASRPSAATMRLAVVIPTLDEEGNLAALLAELRGRVDEIVVSDGGSKDGTVALARRLGATVVEGPPGRGGQLARGAAATAAELLVFLHADTHLAPGACDAVRAALASGAVGGGFKVRFDADRPLLRLGAWLINLRTLLTRVPLGDQAQFTSRETYQAMGGFCDYPLLEDLDFARRLKRRGKIAILEPPLTTSARRFVSLGIPRTIATNWFIWLLYFAGVSPYRLARLYRGKGRAAAVG